MEKVGIKQLKRDTSAILKRVREDNETIEVTYRGDTIAQIIPVMSGGSTPPPHRCVYGAHGRTG